MLLLKKKEIKHLLKKRTFELCYTYYKGWSSYGGEVRVNDTIKATINQIKKKGISIYLTDEEINILDLKTFINKYGRVPDTKNKYIMPLKGFKEIWNSDIKDEFVKQRKKICEDIVKAREENRLRKEKESIISIIKGISSFRQNKVPFSRGSHLIGYAILGYNYHEEEVYTSMGMRFSKDEAIKALKLYRNNIFKEGIQIAGFKYHGKKSKVVPKLDDSGNLITETVEGIQVGCHFVPEFEIDAFLKYYNLDW